MTRILVIGSSHMGAVRQARERIASDWPQFDVTYFGLPGSRFFEASADQNGVFKPSAGDPKAKDLAVQINGADHVALDQFDRILIIGHRFHLDAVLRLCMGHDVAEWARRDGALPLLSESCFTATIRALVQQGAHQVEAQFGRWPNATVVPAALPGEGLLNETSPRTRGIRAMTRHPEKNRIARLYDEAIRESLDPFGYAYLPQPKETRAQAFLTRAVYAREAEDVRAPESKLFDHRHMNADYGYSLFREYALGIEQTTRTSRNAAC